MNPSGTRHCSFCGKTEHEVKKLIAGPTVFICDECVHLCIDILLADDTLVVRDVVNSLKHCLENKNGKGHRNRKY